MGISLDMKYTALYWAMRFVENELDVHIKDYNGYRISIYAEKQCVDYGNAIVVKSDVLHFLKRHKDFVILECVDRLLLKGYKPSDIVLDGREGYPDICIGEFKIYCQQWGKPYEEDVKNIDKFNDDIILYTSRLVSGLLEYKNIIYVGGQKYIHGFFEKSIPLFYIIPEKQKEIIIEQVADISDYEIFEDELLRYKGNKKMVHIPEGIKTIGASAFWNNTNIETVILPKSLERLGGDCFYYCTSLKEITIPESVWIMGNNPFAGCPNLVLKNNSPYFTLKDGVLYGMNNTNLIHYTINKKEKQFIVPNGVTCIGKHCFFACNNLEKIIIPESVQHFENNPFSGCKKLKVENHSEFYHFENGVIYNKFKTTVIGCLNGSEIDKLILPDTVTAINRNSFWNCKGIKELVISKNIVRIGYNPFAGAENLLITNKSPYFNVENGIVYNKNKTEILCATDRSAGSYFKIPDCVDNVNRGVFSGCKHLKNIDFNKVKYIDKSSFTNCISLENLYIPDSVEYIGEWAFSYCVNMKTISINKHTFIDKNAFNECNVKIIWRN